jgi:hypothetical protein
VNLQRARFPVTSVAGILALIVVVAALFGDIDVIQLPISILDRFARSEFDDIIVALLLILVAFVIDQIVAGRLHRQEVKLEAERLRVVKVTMRTVQDVVNNVLNQLQLVRFEAEGRVSDASIRLFDDAIRDTNEKLKELGDLDAYTKAQMSNGIGLGRHRELNPS